MIQNKKQTIGICLVLHQPNLVITDNDPHHIQDVWNKTLFPSITYTYIPLLKMLDHFKSKNIPIKINMVISPTLCSLLEDYMVQELYALWLENLIILGEKELVANKDNAELFALTEDYIKKLNQAYSYFVGLSEGNLLFRFKEHIKNGSINLLATTVEQCYLPHYINNEELINAQIEAGLQAHKHFFNIVSDGFWLPLMAYTPELENAIQIYGYKYTILNTHGVLFSTPTPENGIFSPLQNKNMLTVFAHDSEGAQIIFGEEGLNANGVYRNQKIDIGFEKDLKDLEMLFYNNNARFETGYKYWAKKSDNIIYNIEAAQIQAKKDAQTFLEKTKQRLSEAEKDATVDQINLLQVIDEKMLGQFWYEGIDWLEEVFLQAQNDAQIQIVSLSDLAKTTEKYPVGSFFMSSSEGVGYGENLLNNSNSWIYRYNQKITERMVDLTKKFPNDSGLRERTLNMAARITLFATSSDWARIGNNKPHNREELQLFVQSIVDFSIIFDSLGANEISTEWLTEAEKRYPFFEDINYRIFCSKN